MKAIAMKLAMFVLAPPLALAQNAAASPEAPPLQINDEVRLQIVNRPEHFLERQLAILFKLAPDGELTADDVQRYRRSRVAALRAAGLGQFLWWDLDGDGTVSSAEASAAIGSLPEVNRPDLERIMAHVDTDGDGTLSWDEMVASASGQIDRQMERGDLSRGLLDFDINGDGAVTAKELAEAVDRIAAEPLPPARQRASRSDASKRNQPECAYPQVPKDAELVLIGSYEADGVSPISVSGPDRETNIARISVEPGDKPLFLVAVSYDPVIWKVEGSTGRVAGFLAQRASGREEPGVGVAGLDSGKVTFLSDFRCLGYSYKAKEEGGTRLLVARLVAGTSHGVDHVVGKYSIGAMSVPSGAEIPAAADVPSSLPQIPRDKEGRRPAIFDFALTLNRLIERWREKSRPDTVEEKSEKPVLTVGDVVAPGPVIEYEVLPGEAGLDQLVASGAVVRTFGGRYRIIRDIPRFPPGLYGAHSVTFEIAKGVKRPAGNPGHCKVFMEETGG